MNGQGKEATDSASPDRDALVTQEMQRRIDEGLCFDCAAPGARDVAFRRVVSYLVGSSHRKWNAHLCPRCTARVGIPAQLTSMFGGWWGIPWGWLTIPALFINAGSLWRSNFLGRIVGLGCPGLLLLLGLALVGNVIAERSAWDISFNGPAEKRVEAQERISRKGALLLDAAKKDIAKGDIKSAIEKLKRASQMAPRSEEIHTILAWLQSQVFDLEAALAESRKALRLNPRSARALQIQATALEHLGRSSEAVPVLRRLLELVDSVETHIWYQRLELELGHRETLLQFYADRLEADITSQTTRYLHARLLPEPEKRLEALRPLLSPFSENRSLRLDLIATLIELRRFEETVGLAAVLGPDEFDSDFTLISANIAFGLGDRDRALKLLDASIARNPRFITFIMQRAIMRACSGDVVGARAAAEEIRSHAASSPQPGAVVTSDVWRLIILIQIGDTVAADALIASLDERRAELNPVQQTQVTDLRINRIWTDSGAVKALAELEERMASNATDGADLGLKFKRGLFLTILGRKAEAAACFETVTTSELPSDQEDLVAAELFLGRVTPDEYLRRSLRGLPFKDDVAHLYLGIFYASRGEVEKARENFTRVIDDPRASPVILAIAGRLRAALE